jgi:hypothetical protein
MTRSTDPRLARFRFLSFIATGDTGRMMARTSSEAAGTSSSEAAGTSDLGLT